MKLVTKAAVLGLMVGLSDAAQQPLKSVIISYPKNTPQSVMQQAMDEITRAGGQIKHVYTIIMGFSADAPVEALTQVKTLGADQGINVEDDQIMSINN